MNAWQEGDDQEGNLNWDETLCGASWPLDFSILGVAHQKAHTQRGGGQYCMNIRQLYKADGRSPPIMAAVTVYCTAVVEFLNYHQWRSFCLVLLAAFACFFTLVAWAYIYRHSLFGEMTALLGIKPKVVGSKLSKKSSKKEAMTKDSTAPPPSESICGGEDLKVNNKIPSKSDLEKCADLPILDVNKKSLPFKSLYSSQKGGRRVLVIFIRHFFCGVSYIAVSL